MYNDEDMHFVDETGASASIGVDKGATADAHAGAGVAYALYSGDASLLEQAAEITLLKVMQFLYIKSLYPKRKLI